jgi:hypothetical protein
MASLHLMKKTQKTPSKYQDCANRLVDLLKDEGIRIFRYEIKVIPSGPKEGTEVLFMYSRPRFRVPANVIVNSDEHDPYIHEVIRLDRPGGGWDVQTATKQSPNSGFLSIFAERIDIAIGILTNRKGTGRCSWDTLEAYLGSHGHTIKVIDSSNCNDWHICGPTDELSCFLGVWRADIAESVVLLAAHTRLEQGIAAIKRQFEWCPVIFG